MVSLCIGIPHLAEYLRYLRKGEEKRRKEKEEWKNGVKYQPTFSSMKKRTIMIKKLVNVSYF
jgi:hypothetical protein